MFEVMQKIGGLIRIGIHPSVLLTHPMDILFRDFFLKQFKFTAKLRGKYRDFPYASCPCTCMVSPILSIPHQSIYDSSPSTDASLSPRSIVYMKAHSWCCTFCGFGQMYNVVSIATVSHSIFTTPIQWIFVVGPLWAGHSAGCWIKRGMEPDPPST